MVWSFMMNFAFLRYGRLSEYTRLIISSAVIAVALAAVTATSPPPLSEKSPRGLPTPSPLRKASSSALDNALPNCSIM